ncbi:MAG: hypothetical protein ACR652_15510 [Methylocystis sp.]|uniref:hypothetical protein n=1 Tax=Methylocystis sp. TaxID=1911079 RepID=UPI003DA396FA
MEDSHDEDLVEDADERDQMTAAIVAGLFGEADLKAFLSKAPYADGDSLFTELLNKAVGKVFEFDEEERIELISALFAEFNWNYIINLLLNEASEAGLYRDGETRLLEEDGNS